MGECSFWTWEWGVQHDYYAGGLRVPLPMKHWVVNCSSAQWNAVRRNTSFLFKAFQYGSILVDEPVFYHTRQHSHLQSWSKVAGTMLTEYEIMSYCFTSRLSLTLWRIAIMPPPPPPPPPRINVGGHYILWCSWYSNIDSGEGVNWYRPNTFDHDCSSLWGWLRYLFKLQLNWTDEVLRHIRSCLLAELHALCHGIDTKLDHHGISVAVNDLSGITTEKGTRQVKTRRMGLLHDKDTTDTSQASTKIIILARPSGNLHFSFPCPKLFWASPKFSQLSNMPRKFSTTLARRVSGCSNLLARRENLPAAEYRTLLLWRPDFINSTVFQIVSLRLNVE